MDNHFTFNPLALKKEFIRAHTRFWTKPEIHQIEIFYEHHSSIIPFILIVFKFTVTNIYLNNFDSCSNIFSSILVMFNINQIDINVLVKWLHLF
jgi:hypothetical protein